MFLLIRIIFNQSIRKCTLSGDLIEWKKYVSFVIVIVLKVTPKSTWHCWFCGWQGWCFGKSGA